MCGCLECDLCDSCSINPGPHAGRACLETWLKLAWCGGGLAARIYRKNGKFALCGGPW